MQTISQTSQSNFAPLSLAASRYFSPMSSVRACAVPQWSKRSKHYRPCIPPCPLWQSLSSCNYQCGWLKPLNWCMLNSDVAWSIILKCRVVAVALMHCGAASSLRLCVPLVCCQILMESSPLPGNVTYSPRHVLPRIMPSPMSDTTFACALAATLC